MAEKLNVEKLKEKIGEYPKPVTQLKDANNQMGSVKDMIGMVVEGLKVFERLQKGKENLENITPTTNPQYPNIAHQVETPPSPPVTKVIQQKPTITVDIEKLEPQIMDFINKLDEKKTVKEVKKDLLQLKKDGVLEVYKSAINDFVIQNLKIEYEN